MHNCFSPFTLFFVLYKLLIGHLLLSRIQIKRKVEHCYTVYSFVFCKTETSMSSANLSTNMYKK